MVFSGAWDTVHFSAGLAEALGIGMVAFGLSVYVLKLFLPFNIEMVSKWLDLAGIELYCFLLTLQLVSV